MGMVVAVVVEATPGLAAPGGVLMVTVLYEEESRSVDASFGLR